MFILAKMNFGWLSTQVLRVRYGISIFCYRLIELHSLFPIGVNYFWKVNVHAHRYYHWIFRVLIQVYTLSVMGSYKTTASSVLMVSIILILPVIIVICRKPLLTRFKLDHIFNGNLFWLMAMKYIIYKIVNSLTTSFSMLYALYFTDNRLIIVAYSGPTTRLRSSRFRELIAIA